MWKRWLDSDARLVEMHLLKLSKTSAMTTDPGRHIILVSLSLTWLVSDLMIVRAADLPVRGWG